MEISKRDYFADVAALTHAASFGSGRLIATNLVLTARHLAEDRNDGWKVHLLRDRNPDGTWSCVRTGNVVWRGARGLDLALIQLTADPIHPVLEVGCAKYDRAGELEVWATGFPRASITFDGTTAEYHVPGRLRPPGQREGFVLAIDSADAPRVREGWRGMSGGIVLTEADGQLWVFGALSAVPANFTQGQLEVACSAAAFDDPQFRQILDGARSRPCLAPWPSRETHQRSEYSARHRARTAVNAKLATIHRSFPSKHRTLHGRDAQIASLSSTLLPTSDYTVVAVQAIGGMGKTALARECCLSNQILGAYDTIVGAQALKSEVWADPLAGGRRALKHGHEGSVISLSDFLIEIAGQLGIETPALRAADDLENAIAKAIADCTALLVLDNLETMHDTQDVLSLLRRMLRPPAHKCLITTRIFPDCDDRALLKFPIREIEDPAVCRALVLERIADARASEAKFLNEAVDAIVTISHGHPLGLELLAGKLRTQGTGSILSLRQQWTSLRRGQSTAALDERYVSALCHHVFNDTFREHVGSTGASLLEMIAGQENGIDEDIVRAMVRDDAQFEDHELDQLLSRLIETGCVHLELVDDMSVLNMHPITRAYFAARRPDANP